MATGRRVLLLLARSRLSAKPAARFDRDGLAYFIDPDFRWIVAIMSDPLVQQLPALVGVALGATAGYVTTSLADRSRWRRARDERWDAARMQAYSDFGNAVKRVFDLATRIAAGRGIQHAVQPLTPDDDSAAALTEAEGARARAWESVLLLGDPVTVDAARAWWHEVWRFVWFARGWLSDSEHWSGALAESNAARQRFYDCARRDLGVGGDVSAIGPSQPRWLAASEGISMHDAEA